MISPPLHLERRLADAEIETKRAETEKKRHARHYHQARQALAVKFDLPRRPTANGSQRYVTVRGTYKDAQRELTRARRRRRRHPCRLPEAK